jgi:hypothetical protein
MLGVLVEYRKRFGSTNVATRDGEHARLGRWVAAQRHKYRKGLLSPSRVRKLNGVGMVWEPGESVWAEMFEQLKKFARRKRSSDIPENYPPNQKLATWAHSQRYLKRRGRLSSDRRAKLESIGFKWAIYGTKKKCPSKKKREASPRRTSEFTLAPHGARPARRVEERLYRLRRGVYIQFSGKDEMPESLARFEKMNGEMPPYIPLPRFETTFHVGDDESSVKFKWQGSGPLPREVLDYVNENGCLPRHALSE